MDGLKGANRSAYEHGEHADLQCRDDDESLTRCLVSPMTCKVNYSNARETHARSASLHTFPSIGQTQFVKRTLKVNHELFRTRRE